MPRTAEMLYGKPSDDWKPNCKYLYTVASHSGWSHEAVKKFIKASFDRESTKDLLYHEYLATMEVIAEPYAEET